MSAPATIPLILWLRRDLRVADHPILTAAVHEGGPVIPVFIWAPEEESPWPPGSAGQWWLHHSLKALDSELRRRGSRLLLRRGGTLAVLRALCRETGAKRVVCGRVLEPAAITRDARVRRGLAADGVILDRLPSNLLFEPEAVLTRQNRPFQVFGPFWRACLSKPEPGQPLAIPPAIPSPRRWPTGLTIDELKLLPKLDWAAGIAESWSPGPAAAQLTLNHFADQALDNYAAGRDRPGTAGTSRLSPYLHFGELSPRQVWHALRERMAGTACAAFLRQLGWREFAYHLLYHYPHTTDAPLRENFRRFPWRRSIDHLKSWQRGRTGYPLVDAGMRELWATGWMHNRVRMVAASFLVKDLLIDWRQGARWFLETLVDADLANNTLGWQWTAGCGADAAPFFRIFNPATQGRRFDGDGVYVRRWVPELAALPDRWLHEPHEAPPDVLADAGIVLGRTYPHPIVDHAKARVRALAALRSSRKRR